MVKSERQPKRVQNEEKGKSSDLNDAYNELYEEAGKVAEEIEKTKPVTNVEEPKIEETKLLKEETTPVKKQRKKRVLSEETRQKYRESMKRANEIRKARREAQKIKRNPPTPPEPQPEPDTPQTLETTIEVLNEAKNLPRGLNRPPKPVRQETTDYDLNEIINKRLEERLSQIQNEKLAKKNEKLNKSIEFFKSFGLNLN